MSVSLLDVAQMLAFGVTLSLCGALVAARHGRLVTGARIFLIAGGAGIALGGVGAILLMLRSVNA